MRSQSSDQGACGRDDVYGSALRNAFRLARVTAIRDYVAAMSGIAPDQLLSKARDQHTAFVRQLAMYLCREITNSSFPEIGERFGRDHSTVIHACNWIAARMDEQVAFRLTLEKLESRLSAWPLPKALPRPLREKARTALPGCAGPGG